MWPNQVVARINRGRLSFVASGFSAAPFIFVVGAHLVVRELGRSAASHIESIFTL